MGLIFPPIEEADDHGLLAIGGQLNRDNLLTSYTQGIFPWPLGEDSPVTWFCPDPRGMLFYDKLHVGRTLKKVLRTHPYKLTVNQGFPQVIDQCAKIKRKNQEKTWITKDIITAYQDMFSHQNAYSIEVWENDDLVGGIYGICINRYFSGESMFSLKKNASKIALWYLMQKLNQCKVSWLDTQMITPVVESLGGGNYPREFFLSSLKDSVSSPPISWSHFSSTKNIESN